MFSTNTFCHVGHICNLFGLLLFNIFSDRIGIVFNARHFTQCLLKMTSDILYIFAHSHHAGTGNATSWFNPPFSKNVKTNIARSFLELVDTHFAIGNKLHKIFNRNTVKVSYSCMSNVKSIITSHNTRIIRKSQPQDISAENCNCRNKLICPLQNKCMSKDIVYKATIFTGNTQDTKHYIGMTSNTFKERYRIHIKSFTHKKYSNETELSKHVWHLKLKKTDFTIKWP